MSRPSVSVVALIFVGLGAFLLPALAQDKQAEHKEDAKLIESLKKELANRFEQMENMQLQHGIYVEQSTRRIRALELTLKRAGAKAPKNEAEVNAVFASRSIIELLDEIIDTKGFQEKIKLKTALELIADKFAGRLPIIVDKEAFAAPAGEKEADDPYEEEVVLPPVPAKMVMSTALRLILSQVAKGQATYVIRQHYIEIVPEKYTTAPYFLHQPMISVDYQKRPISEVLQDLSERTGVAINLDPQVGKKANTAIRVTLRNGSLEDALTPITEMAHLKYVVLHRSIYVTTRENAKVIENEEKMRRQRRESAPGMQPGAPKVKRLGTSAE